MITTDAAWLAQQQADFNRNTFRQPLQAPVRRQPRFRPTLTQLLIAEASHTRQENTK